jgi:hypothetical protein
MLQCSNYKAGAAFSYLFTQLLPWKQISGSSCGRSIVTGAWVTLQASRTCALCSAWQPKLRRLAEDTTYPEDKHLYLTAAAALEARGERMALHLPDAAYDRAHDAALHRPVDMVI